MELARYAKTIEEHYKCPMDMEWARDGVNGGIYIVQARPETVQSRAQAGRRDEALHRQGPARRSCAGSRSAARSPRARSR
ncbi:MAG: PEP/pyruvate-binding domain-containing protein [Paracoccaceae bacterium]